jgi:predicted proteasome-type protease
VTPAELFANKVKEEALSHRDYEFNALIEREWMDAIKKVFEEQECPDCKYSVKAGHQA